MRNIRNVIFAIAVSFFLMANAEKENEFSYESGDFDGTRLNYRMAVINSDVHAPENIVIFLHGGSAQGVDNEAQLQTKAVDDIYNFLKDNGYHARLLAPQVPDGHQWEGEYLPAIKALSEKYIIAEGSESFILGGSMGGYGVWNLLTAYPDYFAGAMPVACNTPRIPVENFGATKIYSVVGGRDANRNLDAIQSFFSRLEAISLKGAKLDIEYDWNHRETCEWSFTPERLKFLLSKSAFEANGLIETNDNSYTCTNELIYDLTGTVYPYSDMDNLPAGLFIIKGEKKIKFLKR